MLPAVAPKTKQTKKKKRGKNMRKADRVGLEQ